MIYFNEPFDSSYFWRVSAADIFALRYYLETILSNVEIIVARDFPFSLTTISPPSKISNEKNNYGYLSIASTTRATSVLTCWSFARRSSTTSKAECRIEYDASRVCRNSGHVSLARRFWAERRLGFSPLCHPKCVD